MKQKHTTSFGDKESGSVSKSITSMDSAESERAELTPEQSRRLFSRITWRLIPMLIFCYIIAYIDRVNVGFAKLQLREVFGVDESVFGSVYGLGAGLFFIGYFLFEVPSNLIQQRVGARLWIARIMIIWGIVAVSMMLMRSTTTFYILRFVLGVAEAGFYPGVILYLTYWYPAKERARTIALFTTGAALAGVIGSPLSGAILELHGKGGLDGWQWLFLLEGIPAVLMGIIVLLVLPDHPRKARWLSSDEKYWIQSRLDEEALQSKGQTSHNLLKALLSSRVWLLCLIYFLMNAGSYGFEMWLPTIIKGFSKMSYSTLGLITAIPYFVTVIAMLIIGYHSDRTGERRWHVAVAAASSTLGFALSAYFKNPYLAMVALTLAYAGLKSTVGPFWALGTTFLSGTAAAGGIAFINSVGNLGGFAGPMLIGILTDRTGSVVTSLLILGGALLLMGILVLTIPHNKDKT
jgi:ACS family tartrate transporter-like MFS transporter